MAASALSISTSPALPTAQSPPQRRKTPTSRRPVGTCCFSSTTMAYPPSLAGYTLASPRSHCLLTYCLSHVQPENGTIDVLRELAEFDNALPWPALTDPLRNIHGQRPIGCVGSYRDSQIACALLLEATEM